MQTRAQAAPGTLPELPTDAQVEAFVFGLLLGLALVVVATRILEEWVIASDLADRQRIREILGEMLRRPETAENNALEGAT